MLFNSFQFLWFLPLCLLIYVNLARSLRQGFLLAASYYFYSCWKIEYLPLIVFSTLVDYFVALKMPDVKGYKKKGLLGLSLISNFGLLFFFKYHNFFAKEMNTFFDLSLPLHSFLLPVGISFYTFQTVSYTIDVYRGRLTPQRNLVNFATFVTFFPQLVAGPIERAGDLIAELQKDYEFKFSEFNTGIRLIIWGFFKKVVVADNLSVLVDTFFSNVDKADQLSAWVGVLSFSFQIFCDFSGYSDIARGVARLFGIKLMNNFNMPYFATSFKDFWARWHISLSTWFRDYLYIPLGGGRQGELQTYRNLFITFVVSGIWHGANWTFLIWGIIHAVMLMLEKFLLGVLHVKLFKVPRILQSLWVFFWVSLAWIFFRSQNLSQAMDVCQKVFSLSSLEGEFLYSHFKTQVVLAIMSICIMLIVQYLRENRKLVIFNKFGLRWQFTFYFSSIVIIFLFGKFDNTEFIYFAF